MKDSLADRSVAALLRGREQPFTDEGTSPSGAARLESLATAEGRVRTAEEERDSLGTLVQEDLYIGSCLNVDALERNLESILEDRATPESAGPDSQENGRRTPAAR